MLNNPITQRLLSIAFFLLTAGLLMVLMILFQGPYIFVFVAIAILILGMIFIKSISDQDRIKRKYLLDQLVSHTGLVIEDNSYCAIKGEYCGRYVRFDIVSHSNDEWQVYDMQLMMYVDNQAGLVLGLREREDKQESEDAKSEWRIEIDSHPEMAGDKLLTSTGLREKLLQLHDGVELQVEGNEIHFKQALNEEVEYILHLFDLLCELAKVIEQIEQVVG